MAASIPKYCIYPNCFECTGEDCTADVIFPGECAMNSLCGELPHGKNEKEHRKRGKSKKSR